MTIAIKAGDIDAMAVQLGMAVSGATASPLSREQRLAIVQAIQADAFIAQIAPLTVALSNLAAAVQAQVTADGQSLAGIATSQGLMAAAEQAVAAAMVKLAPQP